ncbi:MAG: EcoKI restriction-modification system protein HsdS [Syntrophorhabdus sp. PtaU1.Bin058]|nr:MAG: EcoKI restriction-modification system protein HsdS [Syntrophorhabdus sp. PtaU1.Bin058]
MITYSIIQKSQLESAKRIDAEYYQPEYLELKSRLLSTGLYQLWGSIEGKFITGPFGSEFNVDNYVENTQFRYVRGKDVKEFFLLENDNVYIPYKDFERLKKYSLKENDILISVVGTIGCSVLVSTSSLPSIFSCKSTAFRSSKIDPYYFLTYLNSRYGKKLLERNIRGAVQTGINMDDLKSLPIFIPAKEKQEKVASFVKSAEIEHNKSKKLYSDSENLLLEELGLKDFQVNDDLAYVVNLFDVKSAHRCDAEYFQPRYKLIEQKLINNFGAKRIKELEFINVTTGQYSEEYINRVIGKPYIRGTDLTNGTVEIGNLVYIDPSRQIPSKKAREGDVVVTRVGTIGISARLPREVEGGTISDNLIRLRFPEEKVNSYYVSLFFNTVGSQLMIRESRGSVQARLNQETLKEIALPILPKPTQQKIADLVRRSHDARRRSKELLEQAKKEVERLIENRTS